MMRPILISWLCVVVLQSMLQACWRRDEDPDDRDQTVGEEIVDDIERPDDDPGDTDLDPDKDVDETVDEEVEPSPPANPVPPPGDVDPVQQK
jgi:hypothetical protein